jgi:oligopeptide/dipeptide ABC transporter ATP-binding protein
MSLVKVNNLVKHFPIRGGLLNRVTAKVHAVNGVSFQIERGETLGIVGESGCGKSTLGRMLARLIDPTSGSVEFDGTCLTDLEHGQLTKYRKHIQFVFQDPYSALNPRMTAETMLREVVRFHQVVPKHETDSYIDSLLEKVGLPQDARSRYPHEFSGGQRQRLNIARALAVKPEFLIADEPVSALDVSVRAQVLNLLMDLKEEFDLTILFVSHDLKVVEHFCDRLLVMYLGTVVEELPCRDLITNVKHPYTQALLKANPIDDPAQRTELQVLEGEVPSPFDPPCGCPFITRCPIAEDQCENSQTLVSLEENHSVACWKVIEASSPESSTAAVEAK